MTQTLLQSAVETPVGAMVMIVSGEGLCFLEYEKADRDRLLQSRLQRHYPGARRVAGENRVSRLTRTWIEEYFKGSRDPQTAVPLDTRGTVFEESVWQAMQGIPYGETRSYKAIAVSLGNPKGSRAVGSASRRNPTAIIVPCHRVIGSSGSLTGYGGGLTAKSFLLAHERAGR
jgi:O-6-methylguanine DNA methyltransferase